MQTFKLRCKEPGCGFVADLLPNGTAVDDFTEPEERWTPLWKNDDGTFECLACGAPLVVSSRAKNWMMLQEALRKGAR